MLERRYTVKRRNLQKKWREEGGAPKTWAQGIDDLIQKDFFRFQNKRTERDVAKALEAKGISTTGKIGLITLTLKRRVNKGKLQRTKNQDG